MRSNSVGDQPGPLPAMDALVVAGCGPGTTTRAVATNTMGASHNFASASVVNPSPANSNSKPANWRGSFMRRCFYTTTGGQFNRARALLTPSPLGGEGRDEGVARHGEWRRFAKVRTCPLTPTLSPD